MAKAPEPLRVAFTVDDIHEVVEQMDRLVQLGRGWINLDPLLDLDDIPTPPSGLSAIFSAKGPPIARATWIAPHRRRNRADPAQIGIEHGLGRKALPDLAIHDLHREPDWRTLSDAPKRGLVIALPPDVDNAVVLSWLLEAGELLSTSALGGRWRASIYDS